MLPYILVKAFFSCRPSDQRRLCCFSDSFFTILHTGRAVYGGIFRVTFTGHSIIVYLCRELLTSLSLSCPHPAAAANLMRSSTWPGRPCARCRQSSASYAPTPSSFIDFRCAPLAVTSASPASEVMGHLHRHYRAICRLGRGSRTRDDPWPWRWPPVACSTGWSGSPCTRRRVFPFLSRPLTCLSCLEYSISYYQICFEYSERFAFAYPH